MNHSKKFYMRQPIILTSASFVRVLILILSTALMLMGCHGDEPLPKGKYEHGIFVINEGNFGAANGSVTFYSAPSGDVEQNIFRNDAGDFAGEVVQSLTLDGDIGYMVINGDNKIEIVNHNTFKSLGTLSDELLDKPKYIQIMGRQAYVSVLGPYEEGGYSLVDSYVLVFDLDTKEVVKKIETDEGTENLLLAGQYLFASNYNYGGSNTVAIIDIATNTLEDQLEVGSGPAGLVADVNGDIWVLCEGDFGGANGTLVRINPNTLQVEKTIDLHVNPYTDLAITPDGENLVYTAEGSVFMISISAETAPDEPLFIAGNVVNTYALDINPENGDIWIGDAVNFASVGSVFIYDAEGVFKTSFTAGINPRQFTFK